MSSVLPNSHADRKLTRGGGWSGPLHLYNTGSTTTLIYTSLTKKALLLAFTILCCLCYKGGGCNKLHYSTLELSNKQQSPGQTITSQGTQHIPLLQTPASRVFPGLYSSDGVWSEINYKVEETYYQSALFS